MTSTMKGADVEKGKAEPIPRFSVMKSLTSRSSQAKARVTITDEDWATRQENPRTWKNSRRWKNALIVSFTGFLSTAGSSIFVPASSIIQKEFGQSREVVTLTTSLYVLALGLGPFLMAPISELYGRQVAYTSSMLGFTAFNLACCFAPTFPSILVLRFFAGLFGSVGPALGVSTIADLFTPAERGTPLSVYAVGPMAGPVLGSIIGSYLILVEWRWTFRLMTILVGLNALATILFLDETFAQVLRKALEEEGGAVLTKAAKLRRLFTPKPEAKAVIIRTFTRPPRMLVNPACALFTLYYAYIYSIIYVYLVSMPLLFKKHDPPLPIFSYNWPGATSGLSYIGLGLGFFSSAATAALTANRIYAYCSKRYNNNGEPEYRLVLTQIGMIIFPIGLLIWGWTAQAQTHWIGPIIGSYILAYGLIMCFNSIQIWLVDAFFPYSASAIAAASFARSMTGCILPIFSDSMFISLGYGWGGTLLALVSLPAVPAPFVLFMYGQQLRERFKFEP